jgi:hypothetical protein
MFLRSMCPDWWGRAAQFSGRTVHVHYVMLRCVVANCHCRAVLLHVLKYLPNSAVSCTRSDTAVLVTCHFHWEPVSVHTIPHIVNAHSCSWHSLTAWPLKMGTTSWPKTFESNYISTLCNIPEEQSLLYTVVEARNYAKAESDSAILYLFRNFMYSVSVEVSILLLSRIPAFLKATLHYCTFMHFEPWKMTVITFHQNVRNHLTSDTSSYPED